MKKLFTIGIILSFSIQQFILPMNTVNAAQIEQKTFVSSLGKESNYKNLFEKILGFDLTSNMLSRHEGGSTSGPIIRTAGAYVRINDIDQIIKSGTVDINGSPSNPDSTDYYLKVNKFILISRNYSYNESVGIPGISESQKSNEKDEIIISGRSISNTGIGRVWISSGSTVYIGGDGELGKSSKWTIFYQWGKPIDHSIAQAAYNEMQRYSMGWRQLPLAPIVPSYNGTPMEFLNSEGNRQRDEGFFMKDGKEIPDSEVPSDKIGSTNSATSVGVLHHTVPNQEFFLGNRPYFGQICGYNEGPCGAVSVKTWETTHSTRWFPGVGSIVFKSDRSGYLYYDASFRPKGEAISSGKDLYFNITSLTSDLKESLKTVIWDSRGDPCETADVTIDPVCKVAYGQTSSVSNSVKISLRADSGINSNTYYSDALADSSDIKKISTQNGTVTLTWTSSNATACTLNGQDIGLSGERTFTGLTNTDTIHYYKCTNSATGKIASLYFKVLASGGNNTIIEESTTNPYSSYISSTNRQKLTKWVFNLMVKGSSLGIDKYSKLIEANITRLRTIVRSTKNKNTSIMAKYLIFELQQIQDKIDEDSLFSEIQY